ncbi:MAG: hypothetical protein R2795_10025 [Saprospiraceae bacterium]
METMSGGDAMVMQQLLTTLAEELERDIPKARHLYAKGDWKKLEQYCHHLKSTLSYSGDKSLIDANLALWEIAKKGGAGKADAILKTIETRGAFVMKELKQILR